jgi:plasmid stability protein
MAKERRMMIRLTETLHKAVRVKAAELGRPVSEIVRDLLRAWVADKVELPPKEKRLKQDR